MIFPFKTCSAAILVNPEISEGVDPNFLHHSGIDADGTMLVWTKKGKTIITSQMNAEKCRRESAHRVVVVERGSKFSDAIRPLLPPGAKIGLDLEGISADLFVRFGKSFGEKRLVGISRELEDLRAIKSPSDSQKIRKAAKLSLQILDSLELSSSMTELDAVRQLASHTAEAGAKFAYEPIVAAGRNSCLPHHTNGKTKLKGIVLMDFGVKIDNYCSDLTRCFFVGQCKEEKKKYAEAKEVFSEVSNQIREGVKISDFIRQSDAILSRHGWGKMIHAYGHGIGLKVHESPHLYSSNHATFKSGMVLAIEPGWYGKSFGVRYENEILVGKGAPKVLL